MSVSRLASNRRIGRIQTPFRVKYFEDSEGNFLWLIPRKQNVKWRNKQECLSRESGDRSGGKRFYSYWQIDQLNSSLIECTAGNL
jgi:hypothetical protein